MTPLVGRGDELAVLREVLSVGGNRTASMLVRGEPGVGKSFLLEAACADAFADRRVLRAAGTPSETHLPFAALHQLLRPALSSTDLLPGRQRSALQAAFGMTDETIADVFLVGLATLELLDLLSSTVPVVAIVDDIQWLDAPTAQVLGFVARRLQLEPVTVLLAMRDGYDSQLTLVGLPEMRLDPLDAVAAAALLDAAHPTLEPRRREDVLTMASGNPLALIEMPRAGTGLSPADPMSTAPMTARLERAFATRLDELTPPARTLLLLGAANDGEVLSEVLEAGDRLLRRRGAAVDELDGLVAAGLVGVDRSSLHFRHPLVRSAVYRTASAGQRRAAHAALAAVMSEDVERRAWHLGIATAQPDEGVASEIEAAARHSVARGATSTTVAVLERAAELSPVPAARGRRLLEAGELAFDLGDPAKAVQLAAAIAPAALDPHRQARLRLLEESVQASGDASYGRADALVARAEEAAAAGDTDLGLAFLQLAAAKMWVTDQGRAVRAGVLDAAERIAPHPDDPRLLAIIGFTDPEGHGGVLRARAARIPPRSLDPGSALMLGSAINLAGAFDLSAEFLAVAVDGFRELGRVGRLPEVLCQQAWTSLHQLSWTVALPAVEEAARLALETQQPIWGVSAQIAEAWLVGLRGDVERSDALCDDAEAVAAPLGARAMLCGIQITRGITALGAGRYERAFDHLRRMLDPEAPCYHHYQSSWGIGDLAEAAVHVRRVEEARAIYAELLPLRETTAATWLQVGLAYAEPLLAPDDRAEALYRDVLASDRLTGWPLYRARLELELGRWLRRQRRVVDSRGPLRAAAEAFDALGVTSFGALARQELRAAGEVRQPSESEAWAVLSPQEIHIARLAAAGLSNREIAERLYLSHRTIGSHLYRIFPKLGITSRAQLRDRLPVDGAHAQDR